MRQGLDHSRYLRGLICEFIHLTPKRSIRNGGDFLHSLNLYRQQCEPLIDVVVKFPGDSSAFLLLRLKQLSAHACEGPFRPLALGVARIHRSLLSYKLFSRSLSILPLSCHGCQDQTRDCEHPKKHVQ